MTLKTYRAASIAEALDQIKADFGNDAVILHTRKFKQGGFLGFNAREMVEVTASNAVNVPPRRAQRPPTRQRQGTLLRDTYESATAHVPDSVTNENVEASGAHAIPDSSAPRVRAQAATPISTPIVQANTHAVPAIEDEIASIKKLVGQVLQRTASSAIPSLPEHLFEHYLRLLESEVASEIADEVVGAVQAELSPQELADQSIVRESVLRHLASSIPVAESIPTPARCDDGRPLTVALVGPTGVGKTTTIAKLAAAYKLRYNKKIGLLTCDTYRIAAVDQLRTYAQIMGIQLHVAQSPDQVRAALDAFSDRDAVLIDTAGRSQHDQPKLNELKLLLDAANPHETHLVLSGASSQSVLLAAASRFESTKPNRVIFTKLDEAVSFGVIINAARTIGTRLSFITTGQDVPDNIEPGRADKLARLALGGATP
ncbi:MAG: flagellar biosynthesis protein FlhF [Phycisphaerales bacterium JB043]